MPPGPKGEAPAAVVGRARHSLRAPPLVSHQGTYPGSRLDLLDDINQYAGRIPCHEPPLSPRLLFQIVDDGEPSCFAVHTCPTFSTWKVMIIPYPSKTSGPGGVEG